VTAVPMTLGDLCELKYGKSLPAAQREHGTATVYGSNGPVGTHSEALLTGPAIVVGRKGSYGEVHYSNGELWPIDTTYFVDRSATKCDLRWLYHLLKYLPLTTLNKSAAIPGLNREDAYRLPVTKPSLDEQRRIAAILDKADALRRKRERALELLGGLTQSIFLEMFGDPAKSVSHGSKLGEMLIEIGSGWSPICLDRPATDGEPGILKLGAITAGSFHQDQNKALPPNLSPKPEAEIREGDILFCRKNTKELVGSSVYVWKTRPGLYMSDLVFRLVPNSEVIDPIFLQTQLSLPSQRRNISDLAGGAAGSMPNISKARLRDLTVVVPELGAQKLFAHIAHQSRAMWSAQSRLAADANMLFSSLQHRAFAGELL
jgi:type I restriction enzyme S subunit